MPNYLCVAGGTIANSQPWSARFYVVSSGTEGATQTTWDTAFQALWNSAGVLAGLPTTTVLTYTYTSTMTGTFHQSTATRNTHSIAGTSAGIVLPMQVCQVVTTRTPLASKAGRGRFYLPAPSASSLGSGTGLWSAAWMTSLQTGLNAFGTALGSSITLQVLHRNATKSGLAALTLTAVTLGDASNKPGIQRRRGDKVVPTRTSWTP